jgi:hypothetical protein
MNYSQSHRLGILTIIAAMTSGCSGIAANSASSLLPQALQTRLLAHQTRVQFTIHWPADRKQIVTARGAQWISPSGASMVIETNNDAKTATIVNAPPANGKTATTIAKVAVPAGQDTFDFTLYDRTQKSATKPAGNVLGLGTVERKIAAGQADVVKVAVAGVISGITITEAPNQPFVSSNPRSAGYYFLGDVPGIFTATAQDADGNTLVPQPANLRVAASVTSTGFLKVTQPDRRKEPQTFQVNLVQGLPPGQTAAIVATATDTFGDHAENSATITEASAIYVAYDRAPKGAAPVVLYNGGSGIAVNLAAGAFSGVGAASALAYDSVDHELFVGDSGHGVVDAFDSTGKPVSGFKTIHAAGVVGLTYDPHDQELYVAASTGVRAYNKSGSPVTLASGAFGQTASPGPLAFVQPDSIAVGEVNGGALGLYNESGVYATGSSLPLAAVSAIVANASSPSSAPATVFVAGTPATPKEQNLFELTPGEGPLALTSVTDPRALAQDPGSGNIYVASGARNELIPITYGTWTHGRPIQSAAGYSTPVTLAITY